MFDINLDDFEAVIFDLDGSLVDSMWMWKAIDIEYLGGFGIEAPKDLQKEIGGRSFVETAIYFKERFGLEDSIEKIGDDWNRMAFDKYTHEVPLKDGADKFLTICEEKGIKLGIASSNSTELIEQVLASHGIRDKFKSIKSGTEVLKGKPAPDIYLTVAKELGADPSKCLVFEDLVDGIIAGKNAGMTVVAVSDDYSRHSDDEKKELSDMYIEDYWGFVS
ncbi:HAD family phosphatase [Butyrivibrio sp. CB08]|uniref:HAD family hydrolase n=1 Tax=Butyrivibrio sp. CB08 TaxID=2364879 RepID=UPI000EA8AA0F|nr:HAD family phosphatase [Butyrivibrio sp. CB08]RKM62491.1 HAD family phosphatase [Butyrivibrio sp. CB08]